VVAVVSAPAPNRSTRIESNWSSVEIKEFTIIDYVNRANIINMLEFFIVMFGGRVFQQTVDIHMGTNRAPLLADLFHYSHKVDFTQEYLKKNEKKLAQSFNFTFHCIDDVFLLNNSV
jgi:hypothetical protein